MGKHKAEAAPAPKPKPWAEVKALRLAQGRPYYLDTCEFGPHLQVYKRERRWFRTQEAMDRAAHKEHERGRSVLTRNVL